MTSEEISERLAPHPAPISFWLQVFGASAAPIFWLGQLMMSYGVTSAACYGADHPTSVTATAPLHGALIAFDVVALLAVAAGGAVSYVQWRTVRSLGGRAYWPTTLGRSRFLTLWGLASTLWFFGAILFESIVTIMVPLCPG